MKSPILITALISLGFVSSVSAQTNSLDDNIIIAQSRTLYKCTPNGVSPAISGSRLQNGEYSCLVPISAGKCVGWADSIGITSSTSSDARGMVDCDQNVTILEDRLEGTKYYKFLDGDSFILER